MSGPHDGQGPAWVLALAVALVLGVATWSLLSRTGNDEGEATVFSQSDLVVAPATPADAEPSGAPAELARTPIAPPTAPSDAGGASAASASLRISGRVLDASGQPVARAAVRLALVFAGAGAGTTTAEVLRVKRQDLTGADGRFAFSGPAARAVSLALDVRAAGHAPRSVEHDCRQAGGAVDVGDVTLCSGGQLTGLVTDGRDQPLAGATVVVQPAGANPLARASDLAELFPPVVTDASGSYRVARLMAGAYRVRASAPAAQKGNAATVQVADGKETRVETIRLAAGVTLAGVVLGPADAKIAGASVRARGERATTGADGRFVVEHLPPGPMQVEVSAVGWLGWQRKDVDPAQELVVRLEPGLSVTAVLCDAATGAPIERYAAKVRRIRPLQSSDLGGPAEQLGRRIEMLRASASQAQSPETRARDEAVAAEARRKTLATDSGALVRVPDDLGPESERPAGTFTADGLDEGLYVVDVLAREHRFVRSAPFELRRGIARPELRLTAAGALSVRGVVVSRLEGMPLAGALVEVVRLRERAPEPAAAATFAWATLAALPPGDIVAATRSGEQGRFELRHLPPGRYCVAARHSRHVAAASAPFDLGAGLGEMRIALAAAATLHGKLIGVPSGREPEARVIALGGATTARTVAVGSDGYYRFEGLEPGEYLVRAFLASASEASEQQVRAFLESRVKSRQDVTLAEGETRALDVRLELAPVGALRGTVTINGAPGAACRVELHSSDPGRETQQLRSVPDARGEYALADVPAGEYELRVTTSGQGRQELHRETVTIVANAPTEVLLNLLCGGLRGRVVAGDTVPAEQLDGVLLLMPGAKEIPKDLGEYARGHRVHEVRVRGGVFRADVLSAGPARAVVQIRGREPAEAAVVVPQGSAAEVELRAGVRR